MLRKISEKFDKQLSVGRKSSNIGAARVGRRRRFPTRTPAPPYSYGASLTVWVGNRRRLPTRAAPMLDDFLPTVNTFLKLEIYIQTAININ